MKIRFLGGVKEVTGSTHLLMTQSSVVMRDCGLFQGRRAEAREKNCTVCNGFDTLDAVVLSHAHIDHCGNLPTLAKHGYRGPVHATVATKDLCEFMLRDAARIQLLDAEYLNKKNARTAAGPVEQVEPIYSVEDADQILTQFVGHQYHEAVRITDDISVTAFDAGHVLGAALHVFDVREKDRTIRIGYAFDLGRKNLPILRDPEQLADMDALVIESTYGNRFHRDINQAEDQLAGVINRIHAKGGKIIIPSFALERAQEILYSINALYRDKRIAVMPVYVDSPLTASLSQVFRKHPELFDDETTALIKSGGWVLGEEKITFVQSADESKALNDDTQPMIIISASGMCESGRILHHLKNNIEDANNAIVIVGYQAEHTLGRRIVDHAPEVRIFGKTYRNRAERVVLNTFSGHADRGDLLDFIGKVGPRCKTMIFVHGEEKAIAALTEEVHVRRPDTEIVVPGRGEEIEL